MLTMHPDGMTIPHPQIGVPSREFVVGIERLREIDTRMERHRADLHGLAIERSEILRELNRHHSVQAIAKALGRHAQSIYASMHKTPRR